MKGFVQKEGSATQKEATTPAPALKSKALPQAPPAQSPKRGLQTPTPAAPKPRLPAQQSKSRPKSTISAASMFDDLASYEPTPSKPTNDRGPTRAAPTYDPPTPKAVANEAPAQVRTAVLPPSDPAPPKKPAASPEKVSSGNNEKVNGAMDIVSEESGIDPTELTDDSNFADIGVDSLLSMVITSRFREELNIELEADFKLFVDCPTVKDLRIFLGGSSDGEQLSSTEAKGEVAVPSEKVSLVSSADDDITDDLPSTETLTEEAAEEYTVSQTKYFDEEEEKEEEEDYSPLPTKEVVLPPVVSDEVEVSTQSSSKVIIPPSVSGQGLLTYR